MVRADRPARRLDHVGGVAEALVRAVPALVRAEIDVAVRVGAPDHLLRRPDVVGVGRADEPIGADEEGVLGGLEVLDLLVDELARGAPLVDRALGDVDRMLVGARQEPRLVALHPVPARDHVRADHLVQGVQARLVVGVGDGRCQVVTGTVRHGWLPGSGTRARGAGRGRTRRPAAGADPGSGSSGAGPPGHHHRAPESNHDPMMRDASAPGQARRQENRPSPPARPVGPSRRPSTPRTRPARRPSAGSRTRVRPTPPRRRSPPPPRQRPRTAS